jgi:hypothetical protein
MVTLLVFIGDDAAGIASRSSRSAHFEVFKVVTLARVADLCHLIVLNGVLVTVWTDAPDVHGEDFAVFVEGNADDALFPSLGTEDFYDVAIVLDRAAIGGNGVGGVFEENHGVGFGRIGGKLLLGGGADPVGNAVRLECKCWGYGKAEEKNQG